MNTFDDPRGTHATDMTHRADDIVQRDRDDRVSLGNAWSV